MTNLRVAPRIIMEVRVQWISDMPEAEVQRVFALLDADSKYPSPLQWVHEGIQRGAVPIIIEDPTDQPHGKLEIRVDGPDEWLPSAKIGESDVKIDD